MVATPRPSPPFRAALLAPRHWPAWLGLGLIRLLARLPYLVLLRIGGLLGSPPVRFASQSYR